MTNSSPSFIEHEFASRKRFSDLFQALRDSFQSIPTELVQNAVRDLKSEVLLPWEDCVRSSLRNDFETNDPSTNARLVVEEWFRMGVILKRWDELKHRFYHFVLAHRCLHDVYDFRQELSLYEKKVKKRYRMASAQGGHQDGPPILKFLREVVDVLRQTDRKFSTIEDDWIPEFSGISLDSVSSDTEWETSDLSDSIEQMKSWPPSAIVLELPKISKYAFDVDWQQRVIQEATNEAARFLPPSRAAETLGIGTNRFFCLAFITGLDRVLNREAAPDRSHRGALEDLAGSLLGNEDLTVQINDWHGPEDDDRFERRTSERISDGATTTVGAVQVVSSRSEVDPLVVPGLLTDRFEFDQVALPLKRLADAYPIREAVALVDEIEKQKITSLHHFLVEAAPQERDQRIDELLCLMGRLAVHQDKIDPVVLGDLEKSLSESGYHRSEELADSQEAMSRLFVVAESDVPSLSKNERSVKYQHYCVHTPSGRYNCQIRILGWERIDRDWETLSLDVRCLQSLVPDWPHWSEVSDILLRAPYRIVNGAMPSVWDECTKQMLRMLSLFYYEAPVEHRADFANCFQTVFRLVTEDMGVETFPPIGSRMEVRSLQERETSNMNLNWVPNDKPIGTPLVEHFQVWPKTDQVPISLGPSFPGEVIPCLDICDPDFVSSERMRDKLRHLRQEIRSTVPWHPQKLSSILDRYGRIIPSLDETFDWDEVIKETLASPGGQVWIELVTKMIPIYPRARYAPAQAFWPKNVSTIAPKISGVKDESPRGTVVGNSISDITYSQQPVMARAVLSLGEEENELLWAILQLQRWIAKGAHKLFARDIDVGKRLGRSCLAFVAALRDIRLGHEPGEEFLGNAESWERQLRIWKLTPQSVFSSIGQLLTTLAIHSDSYKYLNAGDWEAIQTGLRILNIETYPNWDPTTNKIDAVPDRYEFSSGSVPTQQLRRLGLKYKEEVWSEPVVVALVGPAPGGYSDLKESLSAPGLGETSHLIKRLDELPFLIHRMNSQEASARTDLNKTLKYLWEEIHTLDHQDNQNVLNHARELMGQYKITTFPQPRKSIREYTSRDIGSWFDVKRDNGESTKSIADALVSEIIRPGLRIDQQVLSKAIIRVQE